MTLTELILLSVGLAADAFSVAVCSGTSRNKSNWRTGAITALFFGFFQALMPYLGYLLGSRFEASILSFSHWIAFLLLGFIGIKMIIETATGGDSERNIETDFNLKELTVLSIATSIDAFAVGIVFAAEKTDILISVLLIGIITAILSFIGSIIGSGLGVKFGSKAEIVGGAVLILIGLKILAEGVLS